MNADSSSSHPPIEQELLECPVNYTLKLIGGRWKTIILWQLHQGPKRFGDFKRAINGISERILAKQLKELEADDLINKVLYAEVPPRSEYSLTPLGQSLEPVLKSIFQWGIRYGPYFVDKPVSSATSSGGDRPAANREVNTTKEKKRV
ncbi:winged helix-turn-helix transcriptional regulator [Cesiribacter andamanensis]|uniref:Putative HTH-type transcriptional regulator yybR n=1 Tax=Cesiribacter andamanensis AMV16 TaxID=1279009 RepID=M7N1X9_9BACT|nr:helix-turn-helix domain-containing protein [Cesiribacter andamanensis]EMR01282.1 putative HTH-type transcriptional regulator yybR [Cesiribacter andamanensis AMV16]